MEDASGVGSTARLAEPTRPNLMSAFGNPGGTAGVPEAGHPEAPQPVISVAHKCR